MQAWLLAVAAGVLVVHLAASLVVALTRTPCASEALSRLGRAWAWLYPWIERAALVVGHAKELPGGGWAMAQDVEAAMHQRAERNLRAARDRVMAQVETALDEAARCYAYNRAAAQIDEVFRAHEHGSGDG